LVGKRAWSALSKAATRPTLYGDLLTAHRYLGSYLAAAPSNEHRDKLNLCDSAKTNRKRVSGFGHLCSALRVPEFAEYLNTRVRIFRVI